MATYVVLVGTKPTESTKQPDLAGVHAHGPFRSRERAVAFSQEVQDEFTAARHRFGDDRAFPYGEPFVDVLLVRGATDGEQAVRNWVFDPEVNDD